MGQLSTIHFLAATLGITKSHGVDFRPIKWKLRPSPPRPEGSATEEQKNITLSGRRGKGTRKKRNKK